MSTVIASRTPSSRVSHDPDPAALRPLITFAAVALPLGWLLLTPPVVLGLPMEPFVLAVNFLGLLAPALLLTWRRAGGAGVRALLGDAVRPPRPVWWIVAAAFALPVTVWTAASTVGGAQPFTGSLVTGFLFNLVSAALIINIWEETAWAGFVQRRAMARWGTVNGSLATVVLFAGIHAPLAFQGASSVRDVARGFAILFATGIGLRLLVAAVDAWSAGSLLTIGVLHSAFNATGNLVQPEYDWIRMTVTVVAGVGAVTLLVRSRRTS
jgi:membrane protease YdiL (CAAX protease family)